MNTPDHAGSPRVYRGGSWINDARHVRAAYRSWYHPGIRGNDLGFRLARDTDSDAGGYRVIRGGSWDSLARDCRAVYRNAYSPAYRAADLGFRLSRIDKA